jgi:hypothetical protein
LWLPLGNTQFSCESIHDASRCGRALDGRNLVVISSTGGLDESNRPMSDFTRAAAFG